MQSNVGKKIYMQAFGECKDILKYILHKKYKFGKKRLSKIDEEFETIFKMLNMKLLSIEEIEKEINNVNR